MPNTYIELDYESRPIKSGRTSINYTLVISMKLDPGLLVPSDPNYITWGDAESVVALEYAYSVLPLTKQVPDFNGDPRYLVINTVDLTKTGQLEYRAVATYDVNLNTGGGKPEAGRENEVREYIKIGFTIGKGTNHITQNEFDDGGVLGGGSNLPSVPPTLGAIGTSATGVTGLDVVAADMRLTITGYFDPLYVDINFIKQIRRAIVGNKGKGTTNNAIFLGAEVGEMSFLSATGGGTIAEVIPITFEFSYKLNIASAPDGDFPTLTALGQDFVEYNYEPRVDTPSGRVYLRPDFRVVHTYKEPFDYNTIGLPQSQT